MKHTISLSELEVKVAIEEYLSTKMGPVQVIEDSIEEMAVCILYGAQKIPDESPPIPRDYTERETAIIRILSICEGMSAPMMLRGIHLVIESDPKKAAEIADRWVSVSQCAPATEEKSPLATTQAEHF